MGLFKKQIRGLDKTGVPNCKRIAYGYMYDTEESILIADKDIPTPSTERGFCFEIPNRLYMTPKRRWFVVFAGREILPVEEIWVKRVLGEINIERYFEIFGKVRKA